MMNNKKGFTLIELVVSMAIIAILAAAGLSSFTTSQIKGRDGRRKSDLQQLARALELYYNDYGKYPARGPGPGGSDGYILSCGSGCNQVCDWGSGPFCDSKGTVYMQTLPKDPSSTRRYFYVTDNVSGNKKFVIYAKLENSQDSQAINPADIVSNGWDAACTISSSVQDCNYGLPSANTNIKNPFQYILMKRNYLSTGFTLIELLVVIGIISVLSAIVVPNFMGARERARDTQRKSDIRQIQKALELYKDDQSPNAYPTGTLNNMCNSTWQSPSGTVYMNKFPCDPLNLTPTPYVYSRTSQLEYILYACLENKSDPQGVAESSCTSGYKYQVTQP